ncbi:hypothetical protein F290043J8_22180 [Mediterraneibacter gnavus]
MIVNNQIQKRTLSEKTVFFFCTGNFLKKNLQTYVLNAIIQKEHMFWRERKYGGDYSGKNVNL